MIERPRVAAPVQPVSHGICRSCLTTELAKLRPTIAPTPLFSAPAPG